MKLPSILAILTLALLGTVSCGSAPSMSASHSEGARLFEENCMHCHRYADDLREPESFLEKTIHDGGQSMPSFVGVLTEEEQHAIAVYLSSL